MEAPKAAAPPAPLPRLVVIDEERGDAAEFRRLFVGKIEVVDAADFPAGLALVAREPGAVVLLDVSLPGPDGMSLAQYLEAYQPELARRLIVTTGGAGLRIAFRFRFLHGCPFLPKPIDPDELKREVLRLHPAALALAAADPARAAPVPPST